MARINADRRARAQQKIAETGADAALITNPPNVRYLSGLVSSNAALLLPAESPGVLATDSRYAEVAERDCPDLELIVARRLAPGAAPRAGARGRAALALPAQEKEVERYESLDG